MKSIVVSNRVGFWPATLILHLPLLVWSLASLEATNEPQEHQLPFPLRVLASFDPVKQVTLFQCFSNESENLPLSQEYDRSIIRREACCRAIQRSADAILTTQLGNNWEIPISDDVRTSIHCDSRATLAEVPVLDDPARSTLLPSLVLLHAARFTSPTRQEPTAQSDARTEELNVTTWSHLVWDAVQNRVVLDRTSQVESVLEVLSSFRAPSSPALPTETAQFHASLNSQLSDSGGMHRLLHVVITTRIPPEVKSTAEETGSWELDFLSILYLPSGVFVNVHDAFDHPNDARTNLRLQLLTVKGATIDEEQPEFLSPSHAVLVRIQATVGEAQSQGMDEKQHTLTFSVKLHLRYPATISTEGDSLSRLITLSPNLVSGTLRATKEGETYLWTPSDGDFASMPLVPRQHVAWVSAGRQSDAGFVSVVTLLVLLGGTMSMWRGVSKIVEWD